MNDSLSFESFFQGSKKAAHRAMDDHGRAEYDEFALHAGVAIEKLAKAVLVSKNPVYIAEPRNEDMLMHLGGHFQVAEDKVRTVGAKEAIARLRKIGVLQGNSKLDLLIAIRNGAAHAAPDSTVAKGMINPLARTVEALLNHLGEPLDAFWERWTEAMRAAVGKQNDVVFQDVQLRIKQAQHRLDDRLEGLPLPSEVRWPRETGFSFSFRTMDPDGDGEVVSVTGGAGCPACRRQAQVAVEPSQAKGGAIAVALTCPWCQLHLDGPEEVEASGADLAISLEVADSVLHGDYD